MSRRTLQVPLESAVVCTDFLLHEGHTLIFAPGEECPQTRAALCCCSTMESEQGSLTVKRAAAPTHSREAAKLMRHFFIIEGL